MTVNEKYNFAKLRWQCRRGMLELDMILSAFLEEKFAALPENQKANFIELLSCTDPELFAWLMGHEQCKDPKLATMIELIKKDAA